jgi:hypothetical protein
MLYHLVLALHQVNVVSRHAVCYQPLVSPLATPLPHWADKFQIPNLVAL